VRASCAHRRSLTDILTARGYRVLAAGSASDALLILDGEPTDLALIDLGLPDLDGIQLSRQIGLRADCPRIILTADDRRSRIVEGLDGGAVDYVLKPYDSEVLLARVRGALRLRLATIQPEPNDVMHCGDVTVDVAARQVFLGDDPAPAPIVARQFDLLATLVRHQGRVLTVAELSRILWGFDVPDDYRQALRTSIRKLRRALGAAPDRPRLETDHSVGYRLVPPVE